MGILLFAAASWIAGRILAWVTRAFLSRAAKRTVTPWDDAIVARIHGPLALGWTAALFWFTSHWLALRGTADARATRVVHTVLLGAFFWALVRTVDIAVRLVGASPWARTHAAARSLFPIGSRVAKVVVVAFGITAVASALGFPAASLIAGLGIGGIALALAAQKTFENMFGAFSIGVDAPFQEGDVVKVDDLVGTVEAIGLRSTRIRTADRSVVSYPNGKLAESKVESLSARDRLRFSQTLLLARTTTADQARAVLSGLDAVLRAQPKIAAEAPSVRLESIGEKGLVIAANAWFDTTDVAELARLREKTLLEFLAVVLKAGAALGGP
jgi:MscS family membrane protein